MRTAAIVVALVAITSAGAPARGVFLEVVEGTLVKEIDSKDVYLVDKGGVRLLSKAAYERLYADFRGVCTVVSIPKNLAGEPLDTGTQIVKTEGAPHVWLLDNGRTRRHVSSPATFERYGFSWPLVRTVRPDEIDYLPEGPRLE
jgi:hypothetical protein